MAPPPKWDEESSDETSSEEESVEGQPTVAPVRRKFDDEEDSDDVADNWEEEEDSEAERKKATEAAATKAKAEAEAAKNKKPKSQRIEEHREAARRRRAAEEDETGSEDEDEATKRARLRQSEKDADLKNAEDLLANAGLGPKTKTATNKALVIEDKANPGQTIDLSEIPLFRPSTKTQFENLSTTLVPLLAASSAKPHYSLWVQQFVKSICAELPSAEIKKAASGLTALSNEKMKEEKVADKSGKKTKASKTKTTLAAGRDVGRGVADTTSYTEDLGDDDFM